MPNEESSIKKLLCLLKNSLKNLMPNKEEVALAFSGGIDSVVIAKLMKDINPNFTCYVVGIEGSKDLEAAEKIVKEESLKLKKIIVTKKGIEESLPIQIKALKKLCEKNKNPALKPNPVSVSFNLPLFFVAKYAKEKKIIVCHGPDDLLFGSIAYLKINKEAALEEMKKAIKLFFDTDFQQNNATAKYFNKEFLMPYLDEKIIKFCLFLPYELKIKGKTRKYILRKLAKYTGLNDETAFRERKAAQYGSGIIKIMKKIAKEKKMTLSLYIENLLNHALINFS